MPSVTIEGIPQPVEVDTSFGNLSPEDQKATVEHIRAAWAQRGQQPSDASLGGALRQGFAQGAQNLGATARVVGAPEIGAAIAGALPVDPNYDPAGPKLVEAIRQGNLQDAAGYVPRAAVEQAGPMLATIGGGLIGAGVAGPAGGLVGAGVASGAMNFGPNVEQVAENNNRPGAPTTRDYIQGGAASVAESGLDAVGARAGALLRPNARGFAQQAGKSAAAVGAEAGTEAAQSVAQQAITSAGTERGLSVDPAQVVADAVTGAAVRAPTASVAPIAVGLPQSIADAGANLLAGEMTPEMAAARSRVANQYDAYKAEAVNQNATPDEVFNSIRTQTHARVLGLMRDARLENGWLDENDAREVRGLFDTAFNHNKTLSEGALERLGDLTANAPIAFRGQLHDLFLDGQVLSEAARKNRMRGPFETVGGYVGRGAALAGGLSAGGPAGLVGGMLGSPLAVRAGSQIGRVLDGLVGSRGPVALLARHKADKISGGKSAGTTFQLIDNVQQLLNEDLGATRAALGRDMTPEHASASLARRMRRRWSNGLPNAQEDLDALLPEHRHALDTWIADNLEIDEKRKADAAEFKAQRDFEKAAKAAEAEMVANKAAFDKIAADQAVRDVKNALTGATKASKDAEKAAATVRDARERADEKARMDAEKADLAAALAPAKDILRARAADSANQAAFERLSGAQAARQVAATLRAEKKAAEAAAKAAAKETADKPAKAPRKPAKAPVAPEGPALPATPPEAAQTPSQAPEVAPAEPPQVKEAKRRAKAKAPTPAAAPVEAPVEAPAPAPVAPTPDPTPSPQGPSFADELPPDATPGWVTGGVIPHASEKFGIHDLSVEDVRAALGRLVDTGKLDEDVAAGVWSQPQIKKDLLRLLTDEAMRGKGWDPERPRAHLGGSPGGGSPDLDGKGDPIRSRASYDAVAAGRQAQVERWFPLAVQERDMVLAEALGMFATSGDSAMSPANKVAFAEATLRATKDPDKLAFRRAALKPLIDSHTPKP